MVEKYNLYYSIEFKNPMYLYSSIIQNPMYTFISNLPVEIGHT